MLPANLHHRLALVLLAQNTQYLGFAESAFFHEQSKIEEVKSYYFSLLLTGLLWGEAYNSYSDNFNYKRPLARYIPSGTVLYPSSVPEESGFWRYEPGLGWHQIPITNDGFIKYSNMITVEVK